MRPLVPCAALALALASAGACTGDTFDPESHVDTLRVLAVRADAPFARAGERVHLDALTADPNGVGRPVSFAWATCVDPGSAEIPACEDALSPFAIGGPAFDVSVPAGAQASVGVVFAACAGTFRAGRTTAAPIGCVDARGASVGRDGFMWGEKRVTVSATVRNLNPAIAGVTIDGAPWDEARVPTIAPCAASSADDCANGVKRAIGITATPDSAEAHDGLTEDLVAFFFVSQGKLSDEFVRAANGAFTVDFASIAVDPARPILLWIVLRDDRGGVAWATRTMRAQ